VTRRLLGAALAFAAVPLSAGATLKEIQSMMVKPDVLCGRFEQSKRLVGIKQPITSSGRFCAVADKGVLWRTLQPFPNTVRVTRDEIVQLQDGRVKSRVASNQEPAVGAINEVVFALLAGDLSRLEAWFDIAASVQKDAWSVTLKARDRAWAEAIAGVVVSGGLYVDGITIKEASGDRTRIVFSAIQTGATALSEDEARLF